MTVARLKCLLLWAVTLCAILAPTVAHAQATGVVKTIGQRNVYRPGGWVPMLVTLSPNSGASGQFLLRVVQEDLDRDLVSFTRTIALTGGAGDQSFLVYFIPQPSRYRGFTGLPDVSQGASLVQLGERLRVQLCDLSGKPLVTMRLDPALASLQNLDESSPRRGTRLVLWVAPPVTGGVASTPRVAEYAAPATSGPRLAGLVEDVRFLEITPADLPASVLGLEGVDAIIWAAGARPDPEAAASEPRYRALVRWVNEGGTLVVMQSDPWQNTAGWGDLLPVTFPTMGEYHGVTERGDTNPLSTLATMPGVDGRNAWAKVTGPFRVGLATARPGAIVDAWLPWAGLRGVPPRTPWLVRHAVGAGQVAWVAQDLGDPRLRGGTTTTPTTGWPAVWAAVFAWPDTPRVLGPKSLESETKPFDEAPGRDMGTYLLKGMEHPAKASAYITLAVVFFIAYWVVAGPVLFWWLKATGRAEWTWFAFGAVAVGATGLTLLLVKVVLGGQAEVRHFTVVRVVGAESAGNMATVRSMVGLYIPRDGRQRIELRDVAPGEVSVIAGYPLHPQHLAEDDSFPARQEYAVPIRDDAAAGAPGVSVPFRSTLKRLEARWTGQLKGGLAGAAALTPPGQGSSLLRGMLTNAVGRPLRNVYLVFTAPAGNAYRDYVVYVPNWGLDATLKLDAATDRRAIPLLGATQGPSAPELGVAVYGQIGFGTSQLDWDRYWYGNLRAGHEQYANRLSGGEDWNQPVPRSPVLLSLFGRLPIMLNAPNTSPNRVELMRTGARWMDVSGAVAGGALVVLAEVDDAPLPMPLTVDGDVMTGKGTILYQFILPLDRRGTPQPGENPDDSN